MTIPGAGGQVPPRVDQQYQGSQGAATVAPGSLPVIRANKVIVSGPNEGVFVYNGTPALGNPPIDYMSNSATDPFGNTLPQAGTVAYVSSTIWAALTGGQLLFADGTTLASVGGVARVETASTTAAVVLNGNTNEIDLDANTVNALDLIQCVQLNVTGLATLASLTLNGFAVTAGQAEPTGATSAPTSYNQTWGASVVNAIDNTIIALRNSGIFT